MEAIAKLRNVPTSPQKMRIVADMVRGQKVSKALGILKFEAKVGAKSIEKLLLSAVSNWQNKHVDAKRNYCSRRFPTGKISMWMLKSRRRTYLLRRFS